MDLGDLAVEFDDLADVIPAAGNRIKKESTEVILANLTANTTADTGAAISNWQVSADPVVNVLSPHVPSPTGKMIKGKWTHSVDPETTRANNAPIAEEIARVIIETSAPGEPLYISNALPYIQPLDDGHSQQQVAGMVDRAVSAGESAIDAANLLE